MPMTAQCFATDTWTFTRIGGSDARGFLHGQFSNDVDTLAPGQSAFGAFLNPKGRTIAIAHIAATDTGFVMASDAEVSDGLMSTLARYVMRSKVTFEALAGQGLGVTGKAPAEAIVWPLGEADGTALRFAYLDGNAVASSATGTSDQWQRLLIRAGRPRIASQTVGQFVPQMLNLDLLGGISFSKGCYTGQEIVARTQNLGRIKRRMLGFTSAAAPPEPGSDVVDTGGKTVGKVVTACAQDAGCILLAVVRLVELDKALQVDGEVLRRFELPYVV